MSDINLTPNTSKTVEVQSYNVITDNDPDILRQGTMAHIRRYFDRIEEDEHREKERAMPYNINYVNAYLRSHTSDYSINSTVFVVKFIIFLIFIFILWDFLNTK